MSSNFTEVLTQEYLREQGGFRAFRDGHRYYECGQVYAMSEDHNSIRAKVLGLYEYSITLHLVDSTVENAPALQAATASANMPSQ